ARGAALVHSKSSNVVSVWTGNEIVPTKGVSVFSNDYRFDENWFSVLFNRSLDGSRINSFVGDSVGHRRASYGVILGIKSGFQCYRVGLSVVVQSLFADADFLKIGNDNRDHSL